MANRHMKRCSTQRNANQRHSEILPHICQNDYQKNLQKLARMWRKHNTAGENVNW